MLEAFLATYIRQELPFEPNSGQEELLHKLSIFLTSSDTRRAFILRGYAGTGKTSMVAALVRALKRLRQPCILLAPTGRAAKVLASYSGHSAYTIHKKIYRQKQMGVEQFTLTDNLHKNALFIVDEASMISNQKVFNTPFGSGNLLDDLIRYVYAGEGCHMLVLGDTAQLPPVGMSESAALNPDVLRGYDLDVNSFTLTQVARQALDSGILSNATAIREQLENGDIALMPHFETAGFEDICHLSMEYFQEELENAYQEVGLEDTLILTRTNKRTNLHNQGVRARVLWREDEISGGDRLMITKNNYFWTEQYDNLDFLANGDMLDVERISHVHEMYGFRFAEAQLRAVDYDFEIDVMIWLDSLYTDSPEKNYELQKQLFERISEDYPEIRNKRELVQKVMQSPYYNALQVRFAYAVTCHKAQGGQWKRVFIDPGWLDEEHLGEDFYRWLYTALTRAQEKVYLLNFPNEDED
ncbi:MAG: AAA family ATPase [Paludibacteraceae bacterium]|nr:AAA family ATPase [Paludibacteraceae bacterium]